MNEILIRLENYKVLPLVRIDALDTALPLAEALERGGLACLAATFRSAACLPGLRQIRREKPDFLMGVGDVMDAEQGRLAIESGACFLLSPILEPSLLELGRKAGVPVIPGCVTPTEIAGAIQGGCGLINFFPAQALGGVPVLEAVSGPFDQARFLVSNGVDQGNLSAYLNSSKVKVCGVKWIASVELVDQGQYDEISRLTAALVSQLAALVG